MNTKPSRDPLLTTEELIQKAKQAAGQAPHHSNGCRHSNGRRHSNQELYHPNYRCQYKSPHHRCPAAAAPSDSFLQSLV